MAWQRGASAATVSASRVLRISADSALQLPDFLKTSVSAETNSQQKGAQE